MSKPELIKIFHDHLEFKFYYKEHKVIVIDHLYDKEYKLKLTGNYDLPFTIELLKQ